MPILGEVRLFEQDWLGAGPDFRGGIVCESAFDFDLLSVAAEWNRLAYHDLHFFSMCQERYKDDPSVKAHDAVVA